MAETTPKIYSAIAAVMRETSAISKGRENQQQRFKFRGIDDVMNELHPTLAKCGVFIVPEVLEEHRTEGKTKTGGLMFYTLQKIRFRFYAEDGSFIDSVVIGEAMDTGDKASNKALSIGFKYACLQVFCIPTEDEKDPDGQSHEMSPTAQQERQAAQHPSSAQWSAAKKQTKAAPAAGVQQGLPGGPDTPEQQKTINDLLSMRHADGSVVFSKKDTQEISKLRLQMPASALIAYIQEEANNRIQNEKDQALADQAEAGWAGNPAPAAPTAPAPAEEIPGAIF